MNLDATTVMAIISCGIVFLAWLVLPHRAAIQTVRPVASTPKPAETREKIPVSA